MERSSSPAADCQTRTDQLIPLWIDQATQWLVDEWPTPVSADSVHEHFAVWNYLVAMDCLPKLQAVTLHALKDGSFTLTTLAEAFVMTSTEAGSYDAPVSQLTLFTNNLENTVTPDMLMELPLDEPAKATAAQEDEIPSLAQRKRFAYDEVPLWREIRANPAADDHGTPAA